MKLCISEATTLPGTFADDVNHFVGGGCRAMEVWLTKLEKHLELHSVVDTQKLIEDAQLTLTAAAYQGGLLLSQGEARRTHFDHYRKRLELCQTFNIPTLLVVADFAQVRIDANTLPRCIVSLVEAAQWAAGYNIRIGLEFRGADSFCTCLDTALMLIAEADQPNVGVCLDMFHFYKGPSKTEDLARLTNEKLAHVQVCDVAGVPREWMTDSDRVLPGEGDFHFDPLLARLREIQYSGWISLELMNPVLWRLKPTQVTELGMSALRRLDS